MNLKDIPKKELKAELQRREKEKNKLKCPVKPPEPIKPKQTFEDNETVYSERINHSFDLSLEHIRSLIPKDIQDKDISMEFEFDAGCWDTSDEVRFAITYHRSRPNDRYEEQKAQYDKDMKEHKQALKLYRKKLKEYNSL